MLHTSEVKRIPTEVGPIEPLSICLLAWMSVSLYCSFSDVLRLPVARRVACASPKVCW